MVKLTWTEGDRERPDEHEIERLRARMDEPLNDIGNAMRLVYQLGRHLAYWDGAWGVVGKAATWTNELKVREVAHEAADGLWDEVILAIEDGASPEEVEARKRHAEASGNSDRIDAMLREAAPYLIKRG